MTGWSGPWKSSENGVLGASGGALAEEPVTSISSRSRVIGEALSGDPAASRKEVPVRSRKSSAVSVSTE
jgi:hypothetical protein